MTNAKALDFVRGRGVVLATGKSAASSLAEEIVGAPIPGSWWAHPKSHQIFAVLEAVAESRDILVCRVIDGKITLIHRRLWPALVRVAHDFPREHLARVRQEHTPAGHHVNHEIAFPDWVPRNIRQSAEKLSEAAARSLLSGTVMSATARVRVGGEPEGVGRRKNRGKSGRAAQVRRRKTR
jgi:hypothetical protein